MVIFAVIIITISYVAGMAAVEKEVQEIQVVVDQDLLTAARIYHGIPDEQIFYIGSELCFRRDNQLYAVCTGSFKYWYHESYLKDSLTTEITEGTEEYK